MKVPLDPVTGAAPRLVVQEREDGTLTLDYERFGVPMDFDHHLHAARMAAASAPSWKASTVAEFGAVEYGGTFDGTPPLGQRWRNVTMFDGHGPPPGQPGYVDCVVQAGDQYGSSSGVRTLARKREPIVLLPQGYRSTYVIAGRFPRGFPFGANLWVSLMEMHQTRAPYVSVTGPAPMNARAYDPANGFEFVVFGGKDGARTTTVNHVKVGVGYDPSKLQVLVITYGHDPYNGVFRVFYAQEGDTAFKKAIDAVGGTTYEQTSSYELFGLYEDSSNAKTLEVGMAGYAEYPVEADALGFAATLLGGGITPPPPLPPQTTAVSSIKDGDHYVGQVQWDVAVTGPATDVEFFANDASLAKVPVANGHAGLLLDRAKMSADVTNGGFWIHGASPTDPLKSPSISFSLMAVSSLRDLKAVGLNTPDGVTYYLTGVKKDGSKLSGSYKVRDTALSTLGTQSQRML